MAQSIAETGTRAQERLRHAHARQELEDEIIRLDGRVVFYQWTTAIGMALCFLAGLAI